MKYQRSQGWQRESETVTACRRQKQRQLGLVDAAIAIPHRIKARRRGRFFCWLGIRFDVGNADGDFEHAQRRIAPQSAVRTDQLVGRFQARQNRRKPRLRPVGISSARPAKSVVEPTALSPGGGRQSAAASVPLCLGLWILTSRSGSGPVSVDGGGVFCVHAECNQQP